jgi:hypothetical protein
MHCSHGHRKKGVTQSRAGFQPNLLNYTNPGLEILSRDNPQFYHGLSHEDEEFIPVIQQNPLAIMQANAPELYDFYTNVKDAQINNRQSELGIRGTWEFTGALITGEHSVPFITVKGLHVSFLDGSWGESVRELYIYNFLSGTMNICDASENCRYCYGVGEAINFLNEYFDNCRHMIALDNRLLLQLYSDVTGFHSMIDLEFYQSKYWHIESQNGRVLFGRGKTKSGEMCRFTIKENKESQKMTLILVDSKNRIINYSGNEQSIVKRLNAFFEFFNRN